jgi:hypothetical protein
LRSLVTARFSLFPSASGAAALRKFSHGSASSAASLGSALVTVKYTGPIAGLSSPQSSGRDMAAPGRARHEYGAPAVEPRPLRR